MQKLWIGQTEKGGVSFRRSELLEPMQPVLAKPAGRFNATNAEDSQGSMNRKNQEAIEVKNDTLAQEGARQLLMTALEAGSSDYIERHVRRNRDEKGHALVVRNGRAQARKLTMGCGTMEFGAPRVNDRRGQRFTSGILPLTSCVEHSQAEGKRGATPSAVPSRFVNERFSSCAERTARRGRVGS